MIHIKVPATTANMGPGFDCIGMALKLYNHLWVEVAGEHLVVENKGTASVPIGKNNLIYRNIIRFYKELGVSKRIPGMKLIQDDSIPLTRGLGSSAACVVAGLLAANEISGINLPREQLCALAAKIEGHPDNSTPALMGGIVVGAFSNDKLEYIKIPPEKFNGLKFAVMIPDFPLPTRRARGVLPEAVRMEDAIYNVSRAALMVAALTAGDFSKLNTAMDDRLHQRYRASLIPGMEKIFTRARKCGAKGVFLSGAGPSIVAVFQGEDFEWEMARHLERLPDKWELKVLEPDGEGAVLRII
jgi:homoserine kinase